MSSRKFFSILIPASGPRDLNSARLRKCHGKMWTFRQTKFRLYQPPPPSPGIHNVPCALRLHCALIDYILHYNALHCLHYNALHCLASQHEAKVSCYCADADTVVTDCRTFFLLMLVCIFVYVCQITTARHTAHGTQCLQNASRRYPQCTPPKKNKVSQSF